ncbi:hypothetical protein COT72_03795 [archaeon CG10_big_fil_rev_8_21_14_0_10_43_11]|nr:MAG: hypothetical protein COT72_03795 [archaeon CG10_big_fil_rev_8_21_14_0_10_43_11]
MVEATYNQVKSFLDQKEGHRVFISKARNELSYLFENMMPNQLLLAGKTGFAEFVRDYHALITHNEQLCAVVINRQHLGEFSDLINQGLLYIIHQQE